MRFCASPSRLAVEHRLLAVTTRHQMTVLAQACDGRARWRSVSKLGADGLRDVGLEMKSSTLAAGFGAVAVAARLIRMPILSGSYATSARSIHEPL